LPCPKGSVRMKMKLLFVILFAVFLSVFAVFAILIADINSAETKKEVEARAEQLRKEGALTHLEMAEILDEMAKDNSSSEESTAEGSPEQEPADLWSETYDYEFTVKETELDDSFVTHYYRPDGTLAMREQLWFDGDFLSETYDTNEVLRYEEKVTAESMTVHCYNAAGVLIQQEEYAADGTSLTHYYDSSGTLFQKDEMTADGELTTTCYDKDGNPVE